MGIARSVPDTIYSNIETQPGTILNRSLIERDLRALESLGHFDSVRVEQKDGAEGKIIVVFNIRERLVVTQDGNSASFVRFHVEADPDEDALLVDHPVSGRHIRLRAMPALDLSVVSRASVRYDRSRDLYDVRLELTPGGQEELYRLLGGIVGKHVGVFVDGELTILPRVMAPIRGPILVTDGTTKAEAKRLADEINERIQHFNAFGPSRFSLNS